MKNEYKVSIGVEGVEDEYRWRMSEEVSIDEEGIKVKEVWEDWIGVEKSSQEWSQVKWSEESKKWRSQVKNEVKSRIEEVKKPRSEELKKSSEVKNEEVKWSIEESKKSSEEVKKSRMKKPSIEEVKREWRSQEVKWSENEEVKSSEAKKSRVEEVKNERIQEVKYPRIQELQVWKNPRTQRTTLSPIINL